MVHTFQCTICEHKTVDKNQLKTHINEIHKGRKFKCPKCDYTSVRNNRLKRHIEAVHERFNVHFVTISQHRKVHSSCI